MEKLKHYCLNNANYMLSSLLFLGFKAYKKKALKKVLFQADRQVSLSGAALQPSSGVSSLIFKLTGSIWPGSLPVMWHYGSVRTRRPCVGEYVRLCSCGWTHTCLASTHIHTGPPSVAVRKACHPWTRGTLRVYLKNALFCSFSISTLDVAGFPLVD